MMVCNWAASVLFQECQMVIELPAGGGEMGCLGGSSVGITPGVPGIIVAVGETAGDPVPIEVGLAVLDGLGVLLG
jgi:hypothetical protein